VQKKPVALNRRKVLKRYTTLAAAIDLLVENRFALLDPATWKDTNDTEFLKSYCSKLDLKSLYAACFTERGETYHHWQVFAGTNEGVCVELYKGPFLNSLRDERYTWNKVEYLTLKAIGEIKDIDVYRLPFMKRYGFGDEAEFRLIYQSSEEQSSVHFIPIERAWVKRIILNPWLGAGLANSLKVALKAIPGCHSVAVERTTLIDNAQWKSAVDRIDEFEMLLGPPSRPPA